MQSLRCPKCGNLAFDLDDRWAYCDCGYEWPLPEPSETHFPVLLARIAELEEILAGLGLEAPQ